MLSEKFEKNFLILELPYNIGICTIIAHANSLHPPTYRGAEFLVVKKVSKPVLLFTGKYYMGFNIC